MIHKDAGLHVHTVPIISTINFPQTIDVTEWAKSLQQQFPNANLDLQNLNNAAQSINSRLNTSFILRPSYADVIISAYPPEQQFKDFWDAYGGLISLVGGGFAAGAAALIFGKIRIRKQKDSSQTT